MVVARCKSSENKCRQSIAVLRLYTFAIDIWIFEIKIIPNIYMSTSMMNWLSSSQHYNKTYAQHLRAIWWYLLKFVAIETCWNIAHAIYPFRGNVNTSHNHQIHIPNDIRFVWITLRGGRNKFHDQSKVWSQNYIYVKASIIKNRLPTKWYISNIAAKTVLHLIPVSCRVSSILTLASKYKQSIFNISVWLVLTTNTNLISYYLPVAPFTNMD